MTRRGLIGILAGAFASITSVSKLAIAKEDGEGVSGADRLVNAASWLDQQNCRLMRLFALGEERRFHVNQDKQLLLLRHSDGAEVKLQIQILGSFNPRKGDFRWAWANDSVTAIAKQAAISAKKFGEDNNICELVQPTLNLCFERLVPLVAMAAQASGAIGVYRCINEDHLSVFVAITGFDVDSLPSDFWGASDDRDQYERAAVKLLDDWDAENFPIDLEFHNRKNGSELGELDADDLLKKKMEIYRRYWKRDDAEWEPGSFGWPSDHDKAEQFGRFAIPRRQGGVYVVTHESFSQSAYAVEKIDGELFITDCDIEWGEGVVFAHA